MKAVILIPTYNEADNLERLFQKIFEEPVQTDVLIIDDASPDGTADLAERLSAAWPRVHVLRRERKEGLGRAYAAGFGWAMERGYDVFLQMDADLSHDPHALPLFFEAIQQVDAVLGSRYLKGVRVYNWSFRRLLLSKLSNEFIRLVLGIPSTDTTTAYKCFRRTVLEAIDVRQLKGKQNAFLIELVYATFKKGFRVKEIPFMFIERESGESKMNGSTAWESLVMVFRLFLFGR